MKIAFYVEDGFEQIVLTPQSEFEANVLRNLQNGKRTVSVHSGSFYRCKGGWARWREEDHPRSYADRTSDESVFIVLNRKGAVE